jgi:hypothetical protein
VPEPRTHGTRIATWLGIVTGAVILRTVAASGTERPVTPEPAEADRQLGTPFEPGRGPTTSAWREEAITRANELQGLATWISCSAEANGLNGDLLAYVREHLSAVRLTAARQDRGENDTPIKLRTRIAGTIAGAAQQRTLGNLDAVEATLLRLAPDSFVRGEMPSLQAHINRFLPVSDPRRERVSDLARKARAEALSDSERGVVVAALHASNTQRRRDLLRVRSFRNVMFSVAAVLVPMAAALALFGLARPTAIPLCFYPEERAMVVCPTATEPVKAPKATAGNPQAVDLDGPIARAVRPGDILLIEIIGLIAAIVASTVSLRNVRGTSTPYSLAVALALVKIPLGALTTVLGLLLMAGGFVPGLSALDSSAQILAWGLVFGFSQQLLTRLVDQRANALLENVGGRGAAGERTADPA